ncbi:MAG: hypothetical protein ABL921_10595 [Pirellula sp.]
METPNLHRYLSTITIQQLKAYLAKDGWHEYTADGRMNFEKELEPGETQVIFLPAERTHPKFRSHLQNLMFSLSVIEQREPADIARVIATCQVSSPVTSVDIGPPMHEIAALIRGLAQECIDSDQARGKILELARFLLASKSLTLGFTSRIADELWETARSDQSYIPASTIKWFEANTREILKK